MVLGNYGSNYGAGVRAIYDYSAVVSTSLALMYSNASGTLTEAVRINHLGNVGIGTTAPLAKTEISRTPSDVVGTGSTANSFLRLQNSIGTIMGEFGLQSTAPYGMWIRASRATGFETSDPILLQPTGGLVGIGTTGPDAKLDVLSTTEQLRLTYTDGSVYTSFTTSSGGDLTIAPSGGDTNVTGTLGLSGKITTYNNVATEGYGVPAIVDVTEQTGIGADTSLVALSGTGAAGIYRITIQGYSSTVDVDNDATVQVGINGTMDFGSGTQLGGTINLASALPNTSTRLFKVTNTSGISYIVYLPTGSWGTGVVSVKIITERIT
jgi:hypothetical protein